MTNTALRAENSNSRTITFKSKEHEKFYMEYLKKCRYQDVYRRKVGRLVEVYGSSAWHLIFTAMGHQVSEIMKQRKIS